MDYEKKYKEAIKRAKSKVKNDKDHVLYEDDIIDIFPELAESEDERIRKVLIELSKEVAQERFFTNRGTNLQNVIAWLEKQGKQKPAWSEEDEKIKESIITGLEMLKDGASDKSLIALYNKKIDWLKSLKERVQWKQEWSEEDEAKRNALIGLVEEVKNQPLRRIEDWNGYISWLKSLRPQSTWKPSDEQITWLYRAADDASKDSRMKQVLNELLSNLKKLREE